ncbi:Protein of unknown function [Sediminibacillus halophilus]|uniref:Uncharacterized protein n=2 Tax=Sediminibacillus halophilus TaxID=482461 RepID=A0A1G9P868_9BACI|nr:Protein of unknown function [Sediminibacillus halophilus]
MYPKHAASMPQKVMLVLMETAILFVAGWLLLGNGGQMVHDLVGKGFLKGNTERNSMLFVLYLVVYTRMFLTIFYLLKREMPWKEALTIPFAFSFYYVGFSLFALNTEQPLVWWDFLLVLLFLVGSFLNTFSELQRHRWKKDPVNRGKLFTGGLFRFSMHINYFGDLVWVTALALLTRSGFALFIPLLLFFLFVFYNIPLLDRHLAWKYGSQFTHYRKTTSKFIPFIY